MQGLELRRAKHGEVHPLVALSWVRIAELRQERGEQALAFEALEDCLAARELSDGRTHEDVRNARCT